MGYAATSVASVDGGCVYPEDGRQAVDAAAHPRGSERGLMLLSGCGLRCVVGGTVNTWRSSLRLRFAPGARGLGEGGYKGKGGGGERITQAECLWLGAEALRRARAGLHNWGVSVGGEIGLVAFICRHLWWRYGAGGATQ